MKHFFVSSEQDQRQYGCMINESKLNTLMDDLTVNKIIFLKLEMNRRRKNAVWKSKFVQTTLRIRPNIELYRKQEQVKRNKTQLWRI